MKLKCAINVSGGVSSEKDVSNPNTSLDALKQRLDELIIPSKVSELTNDSGYISGSKVSSSGTGNAVTDVTASSDGKLTVTKGNSFLPLSGGALSKSAYDILQIKRTGSPNGAGIQFYNSNGLLGSICMTGDADSGLRRLNAEGSTMYTILDSDNYKSYCTPANIGAAASSHTHSYLPLSGGTLTGNLALVKDKYINSNGLRLGEGLTSGYGWFNIFYNNSAVSSMYGGSEGLVLRPATNNTGYIGINSASFKAMYATTFYGALSGNATSASSATKLATARNINGLSFDGTANRVNYGSCSTAAATAAKTVACTGFKLVTGAEITVKFTVTNTAASPTLNVNSTGAKSIYYRGSAISAGYLAANRTYTFRYNGTQYELVGDIENCIYKTIGTSFNFDVLVDEIISGYNKVVYQKDGTTAISTYTFAFPPVAVVGMYVEKSTKYYIEYTVCARTSTAIYAYQTIDVSYAVGSTDVITYQRKLTYTISDSTTSCGPWVYLQEAHTHSTKTTNYGTLTASSNKLSLTSAVGMNTKGKTYTYNNKSYSGSVKSEVFNDYTNNNAAGDYAHVEGSENKGLANCCHVEGWKNIATGLQSHAGGTSSTASGEGSFVHGNQCTATTPWSVAMGSQCTSSNGNCVFTFGWSLTNLIGNSTVVGQWNNQAKEGYFVVGKGTSSAKANAFRVASDGKTYATGSYSSTGADYAEMFEWLDGNPCEEDRRGRFVTLDGEKIKFAESADDDIIGVVSAAASIVGDAYEDNWNGMYLTDIFGGNLYDDTIIDEDGNEHTYQTLNPDYNPNEKYIPRSERPEWDAVGMMGKLVVVDDGTCEVNSYCVPTTGGIATKSDGRIGYRVLSRIDDTHVKILMR